MTPDQLSTQAKIDVMTAFVKGYQIEFRNRFDSPFCWWNSNEPIWDWAAHEYRVKVEPLTFWVNVYYNTTKEETVYSVPFMTKSDAEANQNNHMPWMRFDECIKLRKVN